MLSLFHAQRFVSQEPNRTVEELAALWVRPTFIIFASIQVFLLFTLFAISRTLSPEWRGFRHWVLDAFCFEEQCHPSCLEPFQTDEATMEQYKVEVLFFLSFIFRHTF
jgi:hypothetical protein